MNKWSILLVGMGTVFIALIVIIGMIQVFHLIFGENLVSRKKNRNPAKGAHEEGQAKVTFAQPATKPPAAPSAAAPTAIGNELVAVIAAAISAASGVSTSAFRIASIQPAGAQEQGFNTPVWGRIERFNR